MTYQSNQFSEKYEIIDFGIFLTSDCEYDDIMLGRIDFSNIYGKGGRS